jgi:hypothetical protein
MTPGTEEMIHALGSVISARSAYAQALGVSFGGDRDLYQVLGYKKTLTDTDYRNRYERGDIAKRIIDAPVNATFRGIPEITENQEDATTFEEAWNELAEKLKIWNRFTRLDKLTGLGRYGVLLYGFNDVMDEKEFATPVVPSETLALLYVQPYSEASVTITKWNNDPTSPDYGMPAEYQLTLGDVSEYTSGSDREPTKGRTLLVHASRVQHIVDDRTESDVFGTPRLQSIYNRLQDLDKIVGGSGEMFWKGARPGYQAVIDADAKLTPQAKEDIGTQLDDYEHNLRRMLRLQGVKLEGLAPQVEDPSPFIDGQLKIIAASKGMPMRILTGSERGELASTQDDKHWREVIEERRLDFVEPEIVRAFIDRMIELGVLPEPESDSYEIAWPDLHTVSDKDRADVNKVRTEILTKYASTAGAEMIIPPELFLEMMLEFDKDQVQKVLDMLDSFEAEENDDIEEAEITEIPEGEEEEEETS